MDPSQIRKVKRWPVVRLIGEGNFGWVFEVEDEVLKVRRALKMLKPEAGEGENYKRFLREARILASLSGPNLVHIYELDRDPVSGNDFYVMDLLTGRDLKKVLRTEGAIPHRRAVGLFLGVLDGLAALHQLDPPVIHRDIKPANIHIPEGDVPKLMDLGIARFVRRGAGSSEDDLTMTGTAHSAFTTHATFIGTVRYASPEQLRMSELTPASDIFAVGLCLYEASEGRHPYADVTDRPSDQISLVRHFERLEAAGSQLTLSFQRTPRNLQPVIRRALAIEPRQRFSNAHAMRVALEKARAQPRPARQPVSRRIWLVAAGVATVLGLALLSWILWPQTSEDGLDQVKEIAQTTEHLLAQVRSQRPARDVLEPAEAKLDAGSSLLKLAEGSLSHGDTSKAGAYLLDARQELEAACEIIRDRHFRPIREQQLAALTDEAARLDAAGVAELEPERWGKLTADLNAPPPGVEGLTPCDSAKQEPLALDELQRIGEGMRDTEAAARSRVQESRAQASATEPDPSAGSKPVEFDDAVTRGKLAFERGEELVKSGELARASKAFGEARSLYDEAPRIESAHRAREEARSLAPQSENVVRELAEGDELYARKEWGTAEEAYRNAKQRIEERIGKTRIAQQAAEHARNGALEHAAQTLAPKEFNEAMALFEDAIEAGEVGLFATAQQGFERAKTVALESLRQANEAQSDAERARRDALEAGVDKAAPREFNAADKLLVRGKESLAARRVDAKAILDSAAASFRDAQSKMTLDQRRMTAARARERARQAKADQLAPEEFAVAERLFADARDGLEGRDPEAAAKLDDAAAAYSKAETRARFVRSVDEVRQRAESARERARQAKADQLAPEEFDAAKRLFAEATDAVEAGRPEAATKFDAAAAAFSKAEARVGFSRSVDEARQKAERARQVALQANAERLWPEEFRAAEKLLADAGDSLEAHRADAVKLFGEAERAFQRASKPPPESPRVAKAREQAENARASAREAGADKSAPKKFAEAEDVFRRADRAAAAGHSGAASLFDDSASRFLSLAKDDGALRDATSELTKARSDLDSLLGTRPCAQLPDKVDRADCETARDGIREAKNLIDRYDAAGALRRSKSAREALSRLSRFRSPPRLEGKDPSSAQPGAQVRFQIVARDPDSEDKLRYVWQVDGKEQSEASPEFELLANPGARIEVTAKDRIGQTVQARWDIPDSRTVDPEEVARATLEQYRNAYQARDIGLLAEVWDMEPKQRKNTEDFFQRTNSVLVKLAVANAKKQGENRVEVRFEQTISWTGGETPNSMMIATLEREVHGNWVIKRLAGAR